MGIPTVSLREPVRVASNAEPVGSSSIHRLRYEVLKTPSESFRLHGGDDGIRTHDPLLAGQVLSQLSYTPILMVVVSPFFSGSGNGFIRSLLLCQH